MVLRAIERAEDTVRRADQTVRANLVGRQLPEHRAREPVAGDVLRLRLRDVGRVVRDEFALAGVVGVRSDGSRVLVDGGAGDCLGEVSVMGSREREGEDARGRVS